MNISIDTASFIGFRSRMDQRSGKLKSAIDTILKKSIYVLEGKGKYFSPVKTGRMRASITDGIHFGDNQASVGPTVEYAKYVHARIPFMTTAAYESLSEIKSIAQKEVQKALK